ncbi:MAG: hypothetical protein ACRD96_13650 [Bryobacteraceae bacterium]
MLEVINRVFGTELVVRFLLGDDSEQALDDAALWMYMNHAATAYACYLEKGRGVLVGPLGADEHGGALDSGQLKATIKARKKCGLSVGYIERTDPHFWDEIPAPIRDSMTRAMSTYDPEQKALILLMRDAEVGLEWKLFPGFRFRDVTPRDLYEVARAEGKVGGQSDPPKRVLM